jgi:hypothetical protein
MAFAPVGEAHVSVRGYVARQQTELELQEAAKREGKAEGERKRIRKCERE